MSKKDFDFEDLGKKNSNKIRPFVLSCFRAF